jgi:hypothetical protein
MKAVDSNHPRTKAEVSPQALHRQAGVILRRLEAWGFLDIQGRGRRLMVSATEMWAGSERMRAVPVLAVEPIHRRPPLGTCPPRLRP